MKPHPDKRWKMGEDAFFTSKYLLAVCDGVGGWARKGIDAGLYSKGLVEVMGKLVENENKL